MDGRQNNVDKTLLDKPGHKLEIKAYKRRWIILGIFIIYGAINAFQWIQYSTITHIITKYYNVSSISVDWTSIIFMVMYPPLVIPASYITDKKGLRSAGLIGCIGTFLGIGIKLMSLRRDRFFVVMIGQVLEAASQLFIVCLPTKIAAVWFKSNEVSTACALGFFGTMLGSALGFIIPPLVVKNSDNLDEIENGIRVLCWTLTAAMVPVTIAILTYFPREPPLPPSLAQANIRIAKEDIQLSSFFKSVGQLFTTNGFLTHMVGYGMSVGVYSAFGTLLSQTVQEQFQGNDDLGGRLGFIMVISGMIGTIVFGVILDKTHLYKEICLLCCIIATTTVFGFMYVLVLKSELMCYIVSGILGVSSNAYMIAGFELTIELTYPSEESTATGMLMGITQIFGSLLTIALGYLKAYYGYFYSMVVQAVLLAVAASITFFVPNIKRRQDAYRTQVEDVVRKPSLQEYNNMPLI